MQISISDFFKEKDRSKEIKKFLKEKFKDFNNKIFKSVFLKIDNQGRFYFRKDLQKELKINLNSEYIAFIGNKILIIPCESEIFDLIGVKKK